MVLRHAAALLPVYFPAYQGPLRQHALVKTALDLSELLEGMSKTDAASTSTVAGERTGSYHGVWGINVLAASQ